MTQRQKHLEKLRSVIQRKHYALSTEETYCGWFLRFWDHALTLPKEMTREAKFEHFLTALARDGCAASTQNQAFNAIRFFFGEVLGQPLQKVDALRAKRPPTLRIATSRAETAQLLAHVPDLGGYPCGLIARLLYGCGLRVCEPLNLRLKDIDLENSTLRLWETKGGQCRTVAIPCALAEPLRTQIKRARAVHEADVRAGLPVAMPTRLATKAPRNAFALGWAWLFPAHAPCRHPRTGQIVRWRVHEATLQRAVKTAATRLGLAGVITPHNLRHAYATHVIDAGASVTDVQSALGHKHLTTTQGYIHPNGLRVRSPLDLLPA